MKRFIFPVLLILASAVVGWLCGYDFDTRTPPVGIWCFMTLYAAASVYAILGD